MSDPRFDSYQLVIVGETLTVADLTPEQAKSALCDCIDLIEKLDEWRDSATWAICNWREGRAIVRAAAEIGRAM